MVDPLQDLLARIAKLEASSADANKSFDSMHHTVGYQKYQVNPGDHRHTGRDTSASMFSGFTLTGAKGGNVALANLITLLTNYGLVDGTS